MFSAASNARQSSCSGKAVITFERKLRSISSDVKTRLGATTSMDALFKSVFWCGSSCGQQK